MTTFCLLSAVTNFNNGLEASSDSDDEDKLHIVEEDSLQESEATAATAAADGTGRSSDAATVLPHNGLNGGTSGVSTVVLSCKGWDLIDLWIPTSGGSFAALHKQGLRGAFRYTL